MKLTSADIEGLSRVERLKLINGLSGIKQACLIGTKSVSGISNLAIFNSVCHIGSAPAYMGFILRPQESLHTGTYKNILETGVFTINHVQTSFIKNAHYTSAKFDLDTSEFELCNLTETFIPDFTAPFVAESQIKIGLVHQESISIKVNNTLLVIGKVEHIWLDEQLLDTEGYLDLEQAQSAGVAGLNSYYSLQKVADFPYARVEEVPGF